MYIIDGSQHGSTWLVLDEQWLLLPSGREASCADDTVFYWECRFRREKNTRCPFRLVTKGKDGQHKIIQMSDVNQHTCSQDYTHICDLTFRNKVKACAESQHNFKYAETYSREKKLLLDGIQDEHLRERVRLILPQQEEFRSACYRAKKRGIPVAPRNLDDIDFSVLESESRNMKDFIIAHDLPSGIVIFGTQETLREFAQARIKCCDGTFKIAPKLFHQVVIMMARVGEIFITCLIACLPCKTKAIYDRLFNLVQNALATSGFCADFTGHYLMCDFEFALRAAIQVFQFKILKVRTEMRTDSPENHHSSLCVICV